MLWDTSGGDFHPQLSSALRGAGNPLWTKRFGISRDLGGMLRPSGQAPSIGAYEATGQVPTFDTSKEAPLLEVFPNPSLSRAFARFEGVGPGPYMLRAFDAFGRMLWQGRTEASLMELPCADWPNGAYILLLENKAGRRVACRWVRG